MNNNIIILLDPTFNNLISSFIDYHDCMDPNEKQTKYNKFIEIRDNYDKKINPKKKIILINKINFK